MRNLELKVHCPTPQALQQLIQHATQIGAIYKHTLHQRDTYFVVPHGRLKLRQWHDDTGNAGAELISYERPDEAGSRMSDYSVTPIEDPVSSLAQLTEQWGVKVVVEKERVLYLYGSTRIHFDTVLALGDFVELETVLPEGATADEEMRAVQEHRAVIELLGLAALPVVAGSYSDMRGTM